MSYGINDTDWDEYDDAEVAGELAWIGATVNRRIRDAFHPDTEVYVQEVIDTLLDMRDLGESITDEQVDAIIRDNLAYDPASADAEEWAEAVPA